MGTPVSPDFCPYKGLQPYTEEDRAYFFGRERDQEIVASNLYAAPLTVLYGASGVGKSSVLMAGVAPQLRQTPRVAAVVFRAWQDANPTLALKRQTLAAVSASAGKPAPVDVGLPFDEFCQQCAIALRGTLFFIFDQFEEYFVYHAPGAAETGFDAELARAINRREVAANFLFSLREDGLSRLDRFKGRIPNLLSNMLRLEHLDHASANSAIRNPLTEYNRNLAPEQLPLKIDDALVEQIIAQVRTGSVSLGTGGVGQAGALSEDVRIETPYLQLVLTRLWEQERRAGSNTLQLATLKQLGGAQQIVRTHLDLTMTRLASSDRDVAARAFRFMVTPSQTKIAYTVSDLADFAQVPSAKLGPVLKKLAEPEVRVLRSVAPAAGERPEPRYEIFHDVLAPAVLDWRERYLDSQRTRRLRLIAASVAALFLLVICAALALQLLTTTQLTQQAQVAQTQVKAEQAQAQVAQTQVSVAQQSSQQQSATQTVASQAASYAAATQDAVSLQSAQAAQTQAANAAAISQSVLQTPAVPGTQAPATAAARATAAAVGTSAAQVLDFKVTEVQARVSPSSSETCPTTFNLEATITVSHAGTVSYRWERSDGVSTPLVSLTFTVAQRTTVKDTWTLTAPSSGWAYVRVLTPNSVLSNQVQFTLRDTIYPDWLRGKLDRVSLARNLYCPFGPSMKVDSVMQTFQNGAMLWRKDTQIIQVLLNDGTWTPYADTWDSTQPSSGFAAPPAGLLEPVRGFGKVWREQLGGSRAKIGWATRPEVAVAGLAQEFDKGSVFRDEDGNLKIFTYDGKWVGQ